MPRETNSDNRRETSPKAAMESQKSTKRQVYSTLRKIKIKLGRLFYALGSEAEYRVVCAGRRLCQLGKFLQRILKGWKLRFKTYLHHTFHNVRSDISEPVTRAKQGASGLKTLIADEKANGMGHALRMAGGYAKEGVKKNAYLAKNLAYYILPLAAAVVFVVTVYQFMSTNYALAVEYQGQVVGYVKEESVYQNAEKMVKGRIVYTESNQQSWSIDPTFSVVAASNAEISDTETLANAILEKSGAEISEAVGLYVDGQFYGATTDALQLENDLEQIKKPYQEQYPDAEIGFVQNVELKSGVYLTSSVVEYSQLSSLLTSQVQGQRTYTIAQGDTPLIIAGKNDIKLADLYALNPVLENGKSVFVGQELLISGAQSFLQVKAVKTEVVEEEIPFTTNKTNDSNLAFGVSKTTQKGEKGLDSVTYTDTYVDGVRVSHTEVARTVLRAPVTEEVSVGAKVTTSGQTITMGTGPLMFPVGAGYKGMSRGFTGVYAHNGLDLRGYVGTPIYAAQSGVVTTAVYSNRGYGIHAVINHGGGMSTLYGHCSGLVVSAGQAVQKGQLIGYVGSTGNSTGPHCHFEVIMNGTRVNPMNYF